MFCDINKIQNYLNYYSFSTASMCLARAAQTSNLSKAFGTWGIPSIVYEEYFKLRKTHWS